MMLPVAAEHLGWGRAASTKFYIKVEKMGAT